MAAYDEVVRRFGEDTDPLLREHVANAIGKRGLILEKAGCCEEAVAAYSNVVRRFGDATEPALQRQVAVARKCRDRLLNQSPTDGR
jgi:hypothetical protein